MKAHGPHGLIVLWYYGFRKSELIQSYILSVAVNYHPYEVAFLLIDYKGGDGGVSLQTSLVCRWYYYELGWKPG